MTKLKSTYAVIGISLLYITTAVLLVLPCLVSKGNAQVTTPKPNNAPAEPYCSRLDYVECNELTAKWGPLCDNGKAQSPIDLKPATATKLSASILSFNRMYQQDQKRFGVINNGYTVSGFFNEGRTSDSLVGLIDTATVYKFAEFYVTWGLNSSTGSEHTVNTKQFASELQLVHYRAEYGSLSQALSRNDENPVLILSVLYNEVQQENLNLKPIVDLLYNGLGTTLRSTSQYADVNINLFKLIPKKGLFYRYKGSLTRPQCDEKVLRIVYSEPQEISAAQLSQLRTIVSTYMPAMNTFALSGNFRSIKQLNGRKVELITQTDQDVGTRQMLVSLGLILLSLLFQRVHSNLTDSDFILLELV